MFSRLILIVTAKNVLIVTKTTVLVKLRAFFTFLSA